MLNGRGYLIGDGFAQKLQDTVRRVEGMPFGDGLSRVETRFEDVPMPATVVFRIGTVGTAAWGINSDNTVTLTNVGVTGYTVAATNIFAAIPASTATQSCAIAKDGTAWYVIQPFLNAGSMVRMGSFSSPWARGATRTVSLTNAGGTVAASNTLIDYPAAPAGKSSVGCVVANDGGTWFLANWEVVTATASLVSTMSTASVVTDIAISATLNTSSCAITIGKTSTMATFSFVASTYTTTIVKLA